MPPPPEPTTLPSPTPAPVADTPGGAAAGCRFGPFVLDGSGGRLLRDGAQVALPPKPFAVLAYLAARPGTLVSKDDLLDAVWGHRFVSDSVLKVAMNTLRAALGEDARAPTWVHTVARRGYRFSHAVQPLAAASPATPAAPPPVAAAPAPPGHLPQPVGPLWGRETDLVRLRQLLAEQALVTIVGPGGVGKTRLALAVAGTAAPERCVDGVWLLRLDALGRVDQVAPALARTLGLAAEAGRDADTLARALAPLRGRVLLDNAEHLLNGMPDAGETLPALLARWHAAAPRLQWLLTSQRALHIAGEQVLPLAPLPVAPAVALLRARVQALAPDLPLAGAAEADLAAIAEALDGLPLALELAAARVPLLGTAGVRARLDERLQLLTRGAADAPDRHRTLRDALAWSVGLLPPRTAALLARLSVFAGSFALDAAQAVAGAEPWATVDDLDELRARSLVVVAEPPRLRLPHSVRAFAAERLAAMGPATEAATRDAHLAWVLAQFTAADARTTACSEDRWLAPLLPDADNLQAAMAWALVQLDMPRAACGDPASQHPASGALRLLGASMVFCIRAGLKQAALGWHRQLAAWLAPPAGAAWTTLPAPLQSRWHMACALLGALGQGLPPVEALAAVDAALSSLTAPGADAGSGAGTRRFYLHFHRAMLLTRLNRGDERLAALAQMQATIGPAPTLYEQRLVGWLQAIQARDAGDHAAYGRFWDQMRAQSLALGDTVEAWRAAWGLGQALYLGGDLDAACAVLDEAVDTMRAADRLRAFTPIAAQAAVLRVRRDASADTQARLREAVRLLQGEGMVWWLADALAWWPLHQGRLALALSVQAWADALVAQRGEARGPVFARLRQEFADRAAAAGSVPAALTPVPDEATALAMVLGPAD